MSEHQVGHGEFIDSDFGKAMLSVSDEQTVHDCFQNALEHQGGVSALLLGQSARHLLATASPDLLLALFSWDDTDEGEEFWSRIYDAMEAVFNNEATPQPTCG
ncbi:MAG: hypothetical protein CVV52_03695 [Spirochaetae bacterium HGW-Spirochaetae-8]|jgi:hypothetical protein|nr:MAG: hypothetical protein CVV52_03695 [Spirochaetae bacterium HGW-Spirochaetae-8]